ncbi:putative Ig domain-containing protein [Pontiella sulfatireligans]|uniref:putative Ig domain-containing protein n=1 Tax=Pontiella sulfatireligans TaxID=2750658 RepID=UPI001443DB74|nr:putative Ig domain-containing protein [Pontiella sulfatireligans]
MVITTSNTAPAFISDPIIKPDVREGIFYQASLTNDITDAGNDALTFRKIPGPDWLLVWSDGTLAGVPENSDAGTNQIVVEATDGGGLSDQTTVQITVNGVSPPQTLEFEATDDSYGKRGRTASTGTKPTSSCAQQTAVGRGLPLLSLQSA